jgi:hypothetical protein
MQRLHIKHTVFFLVNSPAFVRRKNLTRKLLSRLTRESYVPRQCCQPWTYYCTYLLIHNVWCEEEAVVGEVQCLPESVAGVVLHQHVSVTKTYNFKNISKTRAVRRTGYYFRCFIRKKNHARIIIPSKYM